MPLSVCFISLSSYGYFADSQDGLGGGAGRQLYLLSQELKSDLDIDFIVGDYGQPTVETNQGVSLYRAYQPSADATLWQRLNKLIKLISVMRQTQTDLFVTRGLPRKAIMIGMIANMLRVPWVYNIATDSFISRPAEGILKCKALLYKQALKDCDKIIAQSKKQKKNLHSNYSVSSTIVPNGYPQVNETRQHTNRESFLWVGRLDQQEKRPHIYLNIAEANPEIPFQMAALSDKYPEYENRIRNRAKSLDNVEYLGATPPQEIHDYYKNAIALINTSVPESEGFPNTFLEAWRFYTPVIGFDINPGRFANINNYRGFAMGSIEIMNSLIQSLWLNPNKRQQLAESTYDYFREQLNIESIASRYKSALVDAA